jgi:hypothetical protein
VTGGLREGERKEDREAIDGRALDPFPCSSPPLPCESLTVQNRTHFETTLPALPSFSLFLLRVVSDAPFFSSLSVRMCAGLPL